MPKKIDLHGDIAQERILRAMGTETMLCDSCDETMRQPGLGEIVECAACGARFTKDSAGIVRAD